mmetsp:Transcript_6910/g.21389  ORF Transcript_6910/g.21389 Transcript_6910/m.21389 type:complete len:633 (+) Transcript_6910:2-1900(+)
MASVAAALRSASVRPDVLRRSRRRLPQSRLQFLTSRRWSTAATSSLELRDYQMDGVERLEACTRNTLYVLPTGAGKTVVMAELARRWEAQSLRTLFLVHKHEILEQTLAQLHRAGVAPEVVAATKGRPPSSSSSSSESSTTTTTLAMVQTLARRLDATEGEFDRVIVDEAHHSCAPSWSRIFAKFPDAVKVGVTATPFRLDGRALGDVYQELVEGPPIKVLQQRGHLVPAQYRLRKLIDTSDVARTQHGAIQDYETKDLSRAARVASEAAAQDVAAELGSRTAIAFCVDVEHSKSLEDALRRRGLSVAHVDASTSTEARADVLKRFKTGDPQIICNCEIATEGFDAPTCSAVILARPTMSRGLFLQMSGRGLRASPDKKDCLFFDYSDVIERHGAVTDPVAYSLTEGLAEDEDKEEEERAEDEQRQKRHQRRTLDLPEETPLEEMENLKSVNVTFERLTAPGSYRVSFVSERGAAEADFTSGKPPTTRDATVYARQFLDDSNFFRLAYFNRTKIFFPTKGNAATHKLWCKTRVEIFLPDVRSQMHRHFANLVRMQRTKDHKDGWVYYRLKDRWSEDTLRKERYNYDRWHRTVFGVESGDPLPSTIHHRLSSNVDVTAVRVLAGPSPSSSSRE